MRKMLPSIQMVVCRVCNESKRRIRGPKQKRKGFYFLDEKGRYWDSKICPSCKSKKISSTRRKVRLGLSKDSEDFEPMVDTRKRICRDCGIKTANYFYCTGCVNARTFYYWDMNDSYGVVL